MNDPLLKRNRDDKETGRPSFPFFPITVGLLLVAAGALLMLEKWKVLTLSWSPWDLWPILLIVAGLHKMTGDAEIRRPGLGIILMLGGAGLLLSNLDILNLDIEFWPALIVLAGLMILHGAFSPKCRLGRGQHRHGDLTGEAQPTPGGADKYLNLSTVMGGGEYRFDHPNLEGGRISAIMGGFSLDLRHTRLARSTVTLDVHVIMGGVELTVPTDWEVSLEGTPILGGLENKTVRPSSPTGRLRVIGTILMGAIEIKN